MTNTELKELIHLLMMCGIMDKTALERGNVTNEDWLRMESLIDKYQADKTEPEVHGDLISREALKEAFENTFYEDYDDELRTEKLIDNAPTVKPCDNCDLYFIAKTKEEMRKGGAEDD